MRQICHRKVFNRNLLSEVPLLLYFIYKYAKISFNTVFKLGKSIMFGPGQSQHRTFPELVGKPVQQASVVIRVPATG